MNATVKGPSGAPLKEIARKSETMNNCDTCPQNDTNYECFPNYIGTCEGCGNIILTPCEDGDWHNGPHGQPIHNACDGERCGRCGKLHGSPYYKIELSHRKGDTVDMCATCIESMKVK
jgi:hypothetical protein